MKIKDILDPISVHYLTSHNYADINEDDKFYIKLRMYYDKRHSWLEVPIQMLLMLGLSPDDFSKFSYLDTNKARFYLEEDLDVATFYEACSTWHHRTHWHKELHAACMAKDPEKSPSLDIPEDLGGMDAFWRVVSGEWEAVSDAEMLGDSLKDSILVTPIEGGEFIRKLESNVDGAHIH